MSGSLSAQDHPKSLYVPLHYSSTNVIDTYTSLLSILLLYQPVLQNSFKQLSSMFLLLNIVFTTFFFLYLSLIFKKIWEDSKTLQPLFQPSSCQNHPFLLGIFCLHGSLPIYSFSVCSVGSFSLPQFWNVEVPWEPDLFFYFFNL